MLELDDTDKLNIAQMGPRATQLAFFDDPSLTDEQKQKWMQQA
jgi:hypothetical protein